MFRKITTVFIALLLIFSLTGCMFISSSEQIDVRYDMSEIVSVELYFLNGEGMAGRSTGSKGNIDQMEEYFSPIDTLDADQYQAFVEGLEGLTFTNHALSAMGIFCSYSGYTVKITYQNGDYDILSDSCQLYDSGDDYVENNWDYDTMMWNNFIRDCFTVDQPEESTAAPVE